MSRDIDNSGNPACTGCASLPRCNHDPIKSDEEKAGCFITPKPMLRKAQARRLYGDGADLNGTPSQFGILGSYK